MAKTASKHFTRVPRKTGKSARTPATPFPQTISPQLAVLVTHPPKGNEWVHEIKFDGYRLLAFIQNKTVRLVTRNGNDWTAGFPSITAAFAKLKVKSAIIDGEVVVLDEKGRSDFQSLQAQMKDLRDDVPVFYAFDLMYLDGRDLKPTPLIERKDQLENVIKQSRVAPRIVYSRHFCMPGEKLLAKACALGLEGIVSKRADGRYVTARDESWVKSKCDQRQELVIIGYTPPQGSRKFFGALLLGYHDARKRLVYAGKVGTGFDKRLLGEIHVKLKKLEIRSPATAAPPAARERKIAQWVKPVLVAEIRFTGWTRDGKLRHPTFIALRSDKPASQIVRERPIEP
jgi:bifunctional non-homologous end joining protein LigD